MSTVCLSRIMHDEVSETENIRKNLAIERMIIEGCEVLLDTSQTFVRQGKLRTLTYTLHVASKFLEHEVFPTATLCWWQMTCIWHSLNFLLELFSLPNVQFQLLLFFIIQQSCGVQVIDSPFT